MRKTFPCITFLCLLFACCRSASAYDPLAEGIDPRAIAMGKAYTGLSSDGAGFFINPAGLSEIKHPNWFSIYSQPQSGITFASLGGVFPAYWDGAWGMAIRTRTTSNVLVTGEVFSDYSEQDLSLLFSKKLKDNLSLGGNIRVITKSLSQDIAGFEGFNGSGTVIDLGIKSSPLPWLGIGLSFLGSGGKITYKDQTEEEVSGRTNLGFSFQKVEHNLIFNLDLSKVANEKVSRLQLGLEWRPAYLFALRLGSDQVPNPDAPTQTLSNFTAGLGLFYKGVTFDFAYRKRGDPAGTIEHYFGLGYTGPEQVKPLKKEPPPFSPQPVATRKIKRVRFTDLSETHWAKNTVELLATAGLIQGFPDGTFQPNLRLTRLEFGNLLLTAKHLSSLSPIKEIGGKNWEEKPHLPVKRKEAVFILGLPPDISRPEDVLTRGEFAVLLSQTSFGQAAIKRLPPLEN